MKKREKERSRFLEFHYALGGMVLYFRDVDLIKKFFNYTTSTPPNYVLLPIHMNTVFESFFRFFDPNERNFPWISHQYAFPDLDSLSDLGVIKSWICKYVSVLFVRQFNLKTNYSFQKPKEFPSIPVDIPTKRLWLQNLPFFKKYVEELLKDNELLEKLNFIKNNEPYLVFFENFEAELKQSFDQAEIAATPDESKVETFLRTTGTILSNILETLSRATNTSKIANKDELNVYNVIGTYDITEKAIFTDSGIDHLNYHSFMAESIASQIRNTFADTFKLNSKDKYVLNQEDLFNGINKLNLDKEKHIIIVFGLNLDYYINNLKVKNLETSNFKGVQIISFPFVSQLVRNSLFILEKKNLPWFVNEEINEKFIRLYELQKVHQEYNIYASVSDLNKNDSLRNEIIKEENFKDKDLRKYVRQGISFILNIKWRKDIKMIGFEVKNNWDYQKEANRIKEVKDIWENEK